MIAQILHLCRSAPCASAFGAGVALIGSLLAAPAPVVAQAAAGGVDEPPPAKEASPKAPASLLEPPDGNWLVDETGLEYFTFALPKKGLHYIWVDGDTIRLARGPHLKVAGETDTSFTIKIINNKTVPRKPAPPEPTEEERAAVAASYRVALPEVDRLAFAPFGRGLPRAGLWRNGFDVADMNGDGFLDIVHGPARKSGTVPVIFLGDGKGSWHLWKEVTFDEAPYDYGDVVAGDWNGDGKQDLAFGIHIRGVIALIGDGKGGFHRWSEGIELDLPGQDGPPAFASRALAASDWDADGRTDLLVLSEGPRGFEHVGKRGSNGMMLYRNLGEGRWEKHLGADSLIFGDKVVIADIDGDHRPEALTSTNYAGARGLIHRQAQNSPTWDPVTVDTLRPTALVWAVAAGDFDRDGRDDLVVSYRNRQLGVRHTGIDVLLSREGDHFERRPLFARTEESGQIDFHALATGDVDGDGARDLVATSRDGRLFLFLGDGKGSFVREVDENMETPLAGCRGYDVALVDLDGVAGDEVIASFAGESCPNQGSLAAWKVVPRPAVTEPAAPATPDADPEAATPPTEGAATAGGRATGSMNPRS